MTERTVTIEEILSLLETHPERIDTATKPVPATALRMSPGRDDWSANDVLAHLRSCSDMWGRYIRTIVEEDGPTIRAVNPRRWILSTDYPDLEFRPSFRAYAKQRAELLALLRSLSRRDWARAARVTGAGPVLRTSVFDYAKRLATHERPHVAQIERAVGLAHA
jgi:hypothetical protein